MVVKIPQPFISLTRVLAPKDGGFARASCGSEETNDMRSGLNNRNVNTFPCRIF
jgi:hypothetical protein